MQNKPFLTASGQEIQLDDFNRAASIASHADDLALAVVTRLPIDSSRTRAILPYAVHGTADNTGGTIEAGAGGVNINPFWAFLGPLPGQTTDIRSAFFGNTYKPLAAQSAGVGTYRIDLVYGTLFVDQDMAPEQRWSKDPITKATSQSSLVVQKTTYVVVSVQSGVASASPAAPAIPSDPPGGFNFPLAYVRVPNGFTALSFTTNDMIMDVSNIAIGGLSPANSMFTPGSSFFDGLQKTKHFIAAGSAGKEERFFAVDTSAGSFNGATLDNSVDWRNRVMKVEAQTGASGEEFAWHSATSTALPATGGTVLSSLANSFPVGGTDKTVFSVTNGGGTLGVYVDAASGALKLSVTGSPAVTAFFFVNASAQIGNT